MDVLELALKLNFSATAGEAVDSFLERRRWHYGLAVYFLSLVSAFYAFGFLMPDYSGFSVLFLTGLVILKAVFGLVMLACVVFIYHITAVIMGLKGEILDLYFLILFSFSPLVLALPLALILSVSGISSFISVLLLFLILMLLCAKNVLRALRRHYDADIFKSAVILLSPVLFGGFLFVAFFIAALFFAGGFL